LKIFFCVAIDNSDITDRYKDYQSGENVAEAIAATQPTSIVKSFHPISPISLL